MDSEFDDEIHCLWVINIHRPPWILEFDDRIVSWGFINGWAVEVEEGYRWHYGLLKQGIA